MFDNLQADIQRALECNTDPNGSMVIRLGKLMLHPGSHAVLVHRFGYWARHFPVPIVRHVLVFISSVLRFPITTLFGITISPWASIGRGFVVHTWGGIYVGPVTLGEYCYVQTGVVISYATKSIGSNVYFGPGAKVQKNVTIGSNVRISANAAVGTNLPDDCTAIGVPARALPASLYPREFEGEIYPQYPPKSDETGVSSGQEP